ncbi:MAG: glycine-rich domain-containing protein [Candidatus Saccharimonadales bacterium]
MKKIFKAFTVLELIIVILIIGILSAVVYIGYGGIQAQARDASVLSDLDTLDGLMTDYALRNNVVGKAVYLEGGVTDTDLDFTPSEGNIIDAVIDSSDYCLRGYNPNGTKTDITVAFEKESSEGACDRIPPSALAVGSSGITVTGGTETIDGSYTIRTFTSSGTLSVTNGTLTGVNVLIVGGGANGQPGSGDYAGSGGKGGQVVSLSNQTLAGDYVITVGASNQASIFNTTTATSGSGASGGVGATPDNGLLNGDNGSIGTSSVITGVTKYYGGGGGGGGTWEQGSGGLGGNYGGGGGGANIFPAVGDDYGQDGDNGTANTGGGGGGGGGGTDGGAGGNGGSGVVIIRYLTP